MRITTFLRLAVSGGRSDGLRIALTAVGAMLGTLALLAAATVLSIRGQAEYSNDLLAERGLRPGVAMTLVLLCVPVLFFVGQCVRVGAPARDRRLATIRMSGGTPRQVALLAAAETGVAAALGAAVGSGIYFVGRALADSPGPYGVRALPTDVLPPWWVIALLIAGIPALGFAFALLALRRVLTTPFGVVRRRRVTPPRLLPAVLLLIGVGGLASSQPLLRRVEAGTLPYWLFFFVIVVLTLMSAAGVVLGAAPLSNLLGRAIAGRTRRPALLIAARRLIADPWAASRSLAALLVAVFIGAAVLGVRASTIGELGLQAESDRRFGQAIGDPTYASPPDPFYERAYDLIGLAIWVAALVAAAGLLVATAEQVTARRRTLAALTASGTPLGVMARAVLLEVALPLVAGVTMAVTAGILAARGAFDQDLKVERGGGTYCQPPVGAADNWCALPARQIDVPEFQLARSVPVPWTGLLWLGGGAIVVTLLLAALGLLFLRRSTSVSELRAAA
jgi:hypothetical protein